MYLSMHSMYVLYLCIRNEKYCKCKYVQYVCMYVCMYVSGTIALLDRYLI